mmetsp:Transcript_182592/g.444528  ORF Transcript_182592/g.444528 Transcript_182592/m.444528 type:complete len:290 (-) Transcript_182592:102-971(-)
MLREGHRPRVPRRLRRHLRGARDLLQEEGVQHDRLLRARRRALVRASQGGHQRGHRRRRRRARHPRGRGRPRGIPRARVRGRHEGDAHRRPHPLPSPDIVDAHHAAVRVGELRRRGAGVGHGGRLHRARGPGHHGGSPHGQAARHRRDLHGGDQDEPVLVPARDEPQAHAHRRHARGDRLHDVAVPHRAGARGHARRGGVRQAGHPVLVRHRRGNRRLCHDPIPRVLLRGRLRRGRGLQARAVRGTEVQGGERLRRGCVHAKVPDRGRGGVRLGLRTGGVGFVGDGCGM